MSDKTCYFCNSTQNEHEWRMNICKDCFAGMSPDSLSRLAVAEKAADALAAFLKLSFQASTSEDDLKLARGKANEAYAAYQQAKPESEAGKPPVGG